MKVEEERQARQALFNAVTDNQLPHHVPSFAHVGFEGAIKYAGYDLVSVQWGDDPEPYYQAYKKVAEHLPSDVVQFTGARPIRALTAMGCKAFVMSSDGFCQHPEVSAMNQDEYDQFIADPMKFLTEVAVPRVYERCDVAKYGTKAALAWVKGYSEFGANQAKVGNALGRINAEFPYISYFNGAQTAPFDSLSDVLRSFSEISKDARRCPEKILEACDAVFPLLCERYPKVAEKYRFTDYPLHMAPFLNTKHFEKLWWPSFEKLVKYGYDLGQSISLFCENDFERFLDYLETLPGRMMFRFEYGDPKKAKEIVGKKHIVTGFYPAVMFNTSTKEQCVDKAKELIDILAPGGGFEFFLDKAIYTFDDSILEKAAAVFEYVRENTAY